MSGARVMTGDGFRSYTGEEIHDFFVNRLRSAFHDMNLDSTLHEFPLLYLANMLERKARYFSATHKTYELFDELLSNKLKQKSHLNIDREKARFVSDDITFHLGLFPRMFEEESRRFYLNHARSIYSSLSLIFEEVHSAKNFNVYENLSANLQHYVVVLNRAEFVPCTISDQQTCESSSFIVKEFLNALPHQASAPFSKA